MAKRQPFTFESNVDLVIGKINEKPKTVMRIIGKIIEREVRATTLKRYMTNKGKYKILSKALQSAYDYNDATGRNYAGVQIGFKSASAEANKAGAGPGFIGGIVTGQEPDPIKSVVIKNKDLIQEMIGKALDEIRKE